MTVSKEYRKKLDNEGNPVLDETGDFVMELVSETDSGIEVVNSPNWLGLEQALFYSGLRAKAKASANLDIFEFSSLIGAFSNSKNGTVSENTLYYLLNAINADWDSNDIAQLNGFLEQFNFTIRL